MFFKLFGKIDIFSDSQKPEKSICVSKVFGKIDSIEPFYKCYKKLEKLVILQICLGDVSGLISGTVTSFVVFIIQFVQQLHMHVESC